MNIRDNMTVERFKHYHRVGDIMRHFKWETLSDEDKKKNKYLYEIVGYVKHTETGEELVIYKALYHTLKFERKFCARPIEMFMSKVDTEKYPDIKQPYRFMLCTKYGELL